MVETMANSLLILGGSGYIGRNLVNFLIEQTSFKITVADKSLPILSNCFPFQNEAFENERVNFIQIDLSTPKAPEVLFQTQFNFIINLCGETRKEMEVEIVRNRTVGVAQNILNFLIEKIQTQQIQTIPRWIEISTIGVYNQKPFKETDTDLSPLTIVDQMRYEVEKLLGQQQIIPKVILRAAYVYGNGDFNFLGYLFACCAVYKKIKQPMKFLYNGSTKKNTVHVIDVCRVILHIIQSQVPDSSIFNIVDQNDTTQIKLNNILQQIFGIKIDYIGSIKSSMAQSMLSDFVEEANELHTNQWTTICANYGIESPIEIFLEVEELLNKHQCADGTQICRALGFQYQFPTVLGEEVRKGLGLLLENQMFPPIIQYSFQQQFLNVKRQ